MGLSLNSMGDFRHLPTTGAVAGYLYQRVPPPHALGSYIRDSHGPIVSFLIVTPQTGLSRDQLLDYRFYMIVTYPL